VQAFVLNKKYGRKIFLGVIGSFLIETLDDDPIINKLTKTRILKKYRTLFPANTSRFVGSSGRMVLKAFEGDTLLILTCINKLESHCEVFCFYNKMKKYTDQQILSDALRLASLRWNSILVDGVSHPLMIKSTPNMKVVQLILSEAKY
jgi:hypothetical protein